MLSFSNSFLKNKSLNTGCEISCICVDIIGSKLPVTSKICSLFPIFLIFKFRISIGSSTSTVVFAVISISPSCLTIFVLSGENTVLYLSDLHRFAYFISADHPYGNRHYCRFPLGRSPLLGILSGKDMVTINLSVPVDSRED